MIDKFIIAKIYLDLDFLIKCNLINVIKSY